MSGKSNQNKPKCGLCGSRKKALTKTECCNNWICDDEHTYVLFSFARNSCSRNHRRYTLCGYHHGENHQGSWKNCTACKGEFETPDYVTYGTNEHNFEVLENPEKFTVTCSNCGTTTDTLDDISMESLKGGEHFYYCIKEECQKAGFK